MYKIEGFAGKLEGKRFLIHAEDKPTQYSFIFNNCSQHVGIIANTGNIFSTHNLVPKLQFFMDKETYLIYLNSQFVSQ